MLDPGLGEKLKDAKKQSWWGGKKERSTRSSETQAHLLTVNNGKNSRNGWRKLGGCRHSIWWFDMTKDGKMVKQGRATMGHHRWWHCFLCSNQLRYNPDRVKWLREHFGICCAWFVTVTDGTAIVPNILALIMGSIQNMQLCAMLGYKFGTMKAWLKEPTHSCANFYESSSKRCSLIV